MPICLAAPAKRRSNVGALAWPIWAHIELRHACAWRVFGEVKVDPDLAQMRMTGVIGAPDGRTDHAHLACSQLKGGMGRVLRIARAGRHGPAVRSSDEP